MIQKSHIAILVIVLLVIQVGALLLLGRSVMCSCGLKVWDGLVRGLDNSQHLFDWYSLSHLMHGMLGYFLFVILRRYFKINLPIGVFFLILILSSVGWEIYENTYFAIDHYQKNTVHSDYYGDSIINSLTDTLSAATGFWLAFYIYLWMALAVSFAVELLLILQIRDSFFIGFINMIRSVHF